MTKRCPDGRTVRGEPAHAAIALRRRIVSRKLPPTIQNTSTSPSAACVTISDAVQPWHVRNGKPPDRRPASARLRRRPAAGNRLPRRPARPNARGLARARAFGRHGRPRASATLTSALIGVDTVRVLRQPHRPDEHRFRTIDQQLRKRHRSARVSRRSRVRSASQPAVSAPSRASVEAGRVFAHEVLVDAAALDERTQHADKEREIAAGMDVEPVVGDRSAPDRTARDRRNPVAFRPGSRKGLTTAIWAPLFFA